MVKAIFIALFALVVLYVAAFGYSRYGCSTVEFALNDRLESYVDHAGFIPDDASAEQAIDAIALRAIPAHARTPTKAGYMPSTFGRLDALLFRVTYSAHRFSVQPRL